MTASCVKDAGDCCRFAHLTVQPASQHRSGGLDAVSSRSKSQSKCDHLPHAHAPLSVVHPLYLSS